MIIEITNLKCKVTEADDRSSKILDEALSVLTPGHEYSQSFKKGFWDGRTRFFTRGSFPTGLLSEALTALYSSDAKQSIQFIDKRKSIQYVKPDSDIHLSDVELGNIVLRDYQYDSVIKALELGRGIINVATNGGKTEIACAIIKQLLPHLKKGERVTFFTHSREIFVQSHARLEERLNTKIGIIGDGIWEEQDVTIVMIPTISKYLKLPDELPKSKKRSSLLGEIKKLVSKLKQSPHNIVLTNQIADCNEQIKELEEAEWKKIRASVIKTKAYLKSVVAFIGDEVHHASSTSWYDVFMSMANAYYRFGLTGTVDQPQPLAVKRLFGCTGGIITKVSNKFLIENGYSAKPIVHFLEVSEDHDIGNVEYQEARSLGIVQNDYRNMKFVEQIVKRAKIGKQCLIIVNEIEHGNTILGILEHLNMSVMFSNGEETGKFRDKALEGLKTGELRILIATSILDEGVDVSGINCLFILAGGKSMRQLLQRIGRGLRKKADGSSLEIYDCIDYHNSYLLEHSMERLKICKGEEFEIDRV